MIRWFVVVGIFLGIPALADPCAGVQMPYTVPSNSDSTKDYCSRYDCVGAGDTHDPAEARLESERKTLKSEAERQAQANPDSTEHWNAQLRHNCMQKKLDDYRRCMKDPKKCPAMS